MSVSKLKVALLAAVASVGFAFTPSTASAATYKDFSAYGWAAFLDDAHGGSSVDLTVIDGGTTNTLDLQLQKFATFGPNFTSGGDVNPISIVFRQVAANAVPFISIEEENVLNDTGVSWGGFRFILEGGTGGVQPSFDTAASAGFSVSPFTTSTFINDNRELRVEGGGAVSSTNGSNLWQPGNAAGALVIDALPFATGSVRQTFVFKEQPILIPLPAAAWTSLSGLVAVGLLVGAKQARKILA